MTSPHFMGPKGVQKLMKHSLKEIVSCVGEGGIKKTEKTGDVIYGWPIAGERGKSHMSYPQKATFNAVAIAQKERLVYGLLVIEFLSS